jgi:hypothetical protein
MSFLITRKPEKLFASSVKFSRWTALENPYLFELTRSDYGVNSTGIRPAYHPTKPTVRTTGDPVTVPIFVLAGDRIYVNSGVYQGIYTVFSVTNEYIVLDTPYIGVGGTGWVNLVDRLQNFKAYIKIYDGVTNVLIDELRLSPDSTGLLIADVSGILRKQLNTTADPTQSTINKANKGISGSFRIGYGATWLYVSEEITTDVTSPEVIVKEKYYWLSAAKQIDGDIASGMSGIGQNLKEFVPKNLASSEAKFLTMFERPTYFDGFPFFLSFIYDEDFDGITLERHQQDADINGIDVGAETDNTLIVSQKHYVNNMKLRAPNAGTKIIKAWLEDGPAETDGYIGVGGIPIGGASKYN